ncbi:hypothetical protein I6F16_36900 [Bradyrhizobium sp. IC4060]|nr:hypothetical protein [Bradyrhizobium sp. IC4060]
MKATIVKGDPARDPCLGLAALGIALEIDVLSLSDRHSRSMKTLFIKRPRPSMEILIPAPANAPVRDRALG